MLHRELDTAKPRHFQAMGVSQQEFRMWLVLHWAWEGRERRARTIPMPGLVCRVRTARSIVPGLLLPPLLSPISQQARHPAAFRDCVPGTNGTCSHTCFELCRKTVLAAEICWRTEVLWPWLLSPGLISCASFVIPQPWNSPETAAWPLLLCQNHQE